MNVEAENNYKGIKGWFPENMIPKMEEFDNFYSIKMEAELMWGRKLTKEEIEELKLEYKKK